MNASILGRRFSRAASNYDKHAIIQRSIAEALREKLINDKVNARNILDIGTGTGSFLQMLEPVFPEAKIRGLDISWGMLIRAQEKNLGQSLLQADASRLPLKTGIFDLAVSNVALQWLIDIDAAVDEIWRILKKGGRLYFSIFGPQTLKELKVVFPSLDERFKLHGIESIEGALKKAGFLNIDSETVVEKKSYASMVDIVRWLKNIGANYTGYVPMRSLGMRKVWQEAEDSYRKQFSSERGVFATFEVFFIRAEK